jgi:hypothetical protein
MEFPFARLRANFSDMGAVHASLGVARSIAGIQSSMASTLSDAAQIMGAGNSVAQCMNSFLWTEKLAESSLFKLQSQLVNSFSQLTTGHLIQAFHEMNAQRTEAMKMFEQTAYHVPSYRPHVSLPPPPQNTTHIHIHVHIDPSLLADEEDEE